MRRLKKKSRKLVLARETIKSVGGSGWHRTTLRCHETFDTECATNCQGATCECYSCQEECYTFWCGTLCEPTNCIGQC